MYVDQLKKIMDEPVIDRKVDITRVLEFEDELRDIYKYGEAPAISTGLTTVDPHFKWYPGFVYCFTGYPGSGKSELLNYLSLLYTKRMRHDNVAMFSPEAYPKKSLIVSLLMALTGKQVTPDAGRYQMSEKEFFSALQYLHDRYTLIDCQDIPMSHELLNIYSNLRDEGTRFFITDPFNYLADLSGGGNMSTNLNVALSRMKKFAIDHDAINTIVEHPKGTSIAGGGEPPDASPWTLFGGSMWYNKMDVIVSVDRLPDTVRLRSWKVKLQRIVGKPDPEGVDLRWDHGVYHETNKSDYFND